MAEGFKVVSRNCPYCGIQPKDTSRPGRASSFEWECGSFIWGDTVKQSTHCELMVSEKENEKLRAVLEHCIQRLHVSTMYTTDKEFTLAQVEAIKMAQEALKRAVEGRKMGAEK